MKKLSYWARKHVTAARWLIVAGNLLLLQLAFVLAELLDRAGWLLPAFFLPLTVGLFVLVAAFYALQPRLSGRSKYLMRKSCDALLLALGFLMTTLVAQQLNQQQGWNETAMASKPLPSSQELVIPSTRAEPGSKMHLSRKDKRLLRSEFRFQLKRYAKAKITGNKQDGLEALLILVTIIGVLGLFALISALACNISCSGADGLAIVVFLVGLAGLIWGTIAVFRSIKRGRIRRENQRKQAAAADHATAWLNPPLAY